MKVYNLSYNNKELSEEVYSITGRPYGFFRSLAIGGTGSPPLSFYGGPDEVMRIIHQNVDRKYTNIEILRNGIIIRFKSRLENYGVPLKITELKQIKFSKANITSKNDFAYLLEINLVSGEKFLFQVKKHEKPGLVRFFEKQIFSDCFTPDH